MKEQQVEESADNPAGPEGVEKQPSTEKPPATRKKKKRGLFSAKEAGLTKAELKELNKNLTKAQEDVKRLEKELAEKTAAADENYDKFVRLQAEFANFMKRNQRELSGTLKFAAEALIIEILPALNNFETALLAAEKVPETKNFAIGMEMILKQLMDVLKAKGVEEIDPGDQTFDPKLHTAVEKVETDEHPEDHVIEVVRKGYKLHDRVVQPASVKVAVPVTRSEKEEGPGPENGGEVHIPLEDGDGPRKGEAEENEESTE